MSPLKAYSPKAREEPLLLDTDEPREGASPAVEAEGPSDAGARLGFDAGAAVGKEQAPPARRKLFSGRAVALALAVNVLLVLLLAALMQLEDRGTRPVYWIWLSDRPGGAAAEGAAEPGAPAPETMERLR